jgi:hypothetical protein
MIALRDILIFAGLAAFAAAVIASLFPAGEGVTAVPACSDCAFKLAEKEEAAFEKALRTLRERLNKYAVRYGLRDLLNVEEGAARELAEVVHWELSKFSGVNFGTKALAALMAYREYALGRKSPYGAAAKNWLEVGGSARLLYYTPNTAYQYAEKAKAERPAAVEEMLAEALRRLFLKPGADHLHRFVELLGSGKLALTPEREDESAYVFRLFRLEEGGGLKELDIKLKIEKVGESILYELKFENVERWRGFFKPELEAAEKAAKAVKERLLVKDRLPYMVGWANSDVGISEGRLAMGTTHLWQLAETHALFNWSNTTVLGVNLTLEGPKLRFDAYTPLENLDKAVRESAESGWLHMLGTKKGLEDLMHVKSWEGLKQWVAKNWDIVVDAAVKRLGKGVRGKLEALRDRLNDDKIAREAIGPAHLLIQSEKLGVNEETLKYFGAVISGTIDGDGHVSAAMKRVKLASGERAAALLWAAALAAHGIKTKIEVGSAYHVTASGDDAVKLAGLYFRYGAPLLEGNNRLKNHKLAEAVELGAEELDIRWERLRRRTEGGPVAADLIISAGGDAVKYNVYLRRDEIMLQFQSTDRSRVELAAHLLRLAGVGAEVRKVGNRNEWYVVVYTDKLAAGHEKLRKALAEIVKEAMKRNAVNTDTAERWLEKLEEGRVLMEGWPKYYVGLANSGALVVIFASPNSDSIEREAQRLEKIGLKRGDHFTVKMPGEGRDGYVYIRKEGLAYAAWLSENSEDKEQRELARGFVELILRRAEEADGGECGEVCKKVKEIVNEGKSWSSQELERLEGKAEVNGKTYFVKVIGGEAVEEEQNGKTLLRIKIKAEVGRVKDGQIEDRVVSEYTITYSRHGRKNMAVGRAVVSAADAERLVAVIEALTGRKPKTYRRSDDKIEIKCYGGHLEGFMRYKELAGTIKNWLEKTGR